MLSKDPSNHTNDRNMASSATDSSAAAAASADSSLWDIRLCLSPLDMAKKYDNTFLEPPLL